MPQICTCCGNIRKKRNEKDKSIPDKRRRSYCSIGKSKINPRGNLVLSDKYSQIPLQRTQVSPEKNLDVFTQKHPYPLPTEKDPLYLKLDPTPQRKKFKIEENLLSEKAVPAESMEIPVDSSDVMIEADDPSTLIHAHRQDNIAAKENLLLYHFNNDDNENFTADPPSRDCISVDDFDATPNGRVAKDSKNPHTPIRFEELLLISLSQNKTINVRVIGKIIQKGYQYFLQSLEIKEHFILLSVNTIKDIPSNHVVQVFGTLFMKGSPHELSRTPSVGGNLSQLKLKVRFFRDFDNIDIFKYFAALSLLKPYIPVFVKRMMGEAAGEKELALIEEAADSMGNRKILEEENGRFSEKRPAAIAEEGHLPNEDLTHAEDDSALEEESLVVAKDPVVPDNSSQTTSFEYAEYLVLDEQDLIAAEEDLLPYRHNNEDKNEEELKISVGSDLSLNDSVADVLEDGPHVPMSIEEIVPIRSLQNWTNHNVKVIGRMVCRDDQYFLQSVEIEELSIILDVHSIHNIPTNKVVEAFGMLFMDGILEYQPYIRLKVRFFRCFDNVDIVKYCEALLFLKPYIPAFVKRAAC